MITDVHAHIIVPALLREAAPGDPWRPHVFWENGRQVIEHGGRRLTSAVREIVHADGILAAQDAAGVDRLVLSPWASLLCYEAPPADGLRVSRTYNEALARLAEAYPDRVRALGTVPLQDPALAAREIETVMRLPGLCGVEVAASVNGAYLGDDRFRPFWAAAEAAGAVVFVHPTTRGFDLPAFADYSLWNAVGNPLETTITAAQMVMAGVMETHPRLKVVLAHGGGALPALRGRLRRAHQVTAPARARLREPVEASLRRFYYDTLTHDAAVLRGLVEFAGADRVVLGSDYPFDMGLERPVDAVRALGLPPDDEAKILGGNAARLLASGA
ncbi:MAG: amidohydrolase family protein [Armatimonadota bacterium]|nr:amidohydrolase family protein [Armatimonadota bacterium]MDR7486814.1 amidohydrolase family protein [Armatimonadota bacterium]MDR7533847.1 amidohydrolase family protein [Armatimonadota bacterium]MDR7535095.1 amidohydrolase family protein [Armatimonadota bacterium]